MLIEIGSPVCGVDPLVLVETEYWVAKEHWERTGRIPKNISPVRKAHRGRYKKTKKKLNVYYGYHNTPSPRPDWKRYSRRHQNRIWWIWLTLTVGGKVSGRDSRSLAWDEQLYRSRFEAVRWPTTMEMVSVACAGACTWVLTIGDGHKDRLDWGRLAWAGYVDNARPDIALENRPRSPTFWGT